MLLSGSQNQVDTSAQGGTNQSPTQITNRLNGVSHIWVRKPMPGGIQVQLGRLEPLVDSMSSRILSNRISYRSMLTPNSKMYFSGPTLDAQKNLRVQILILKIRAQVLGTRVQSLAAEWATNTNPRLISEPAGVELPSCQLSSDWGGALEASLTAWSRPVAQPLASVRHLRIQPKTAGRK